MGPTDDCGLWVPVAVTAVRSSTGGLGTVDPVDRYEYRVRSGSVMADSCGERSVDSRSI